MEETFAALADLQRAGRVLSIGVSNFTAERLARASDVSPVSISANQVELHPLLYQKELVESCQWAGVVVVAYSPLARGQVNNNPTITAAAAKYGKSPAQISLRWLLQKGCVVIPKAGSEEHLRANLDLFDWALAPEDEAAIDVLEDHVRLVSGEWAEF